MGEVRILPMLSFSLSLTYTQTNNHTHTDTEIHGQMDILINTYSVCEVFGHNIWDMLIFCVQYTNLPK